MRREILNRFTHVVADHLVLSLLWLVGCLPVVTAPAATAALFELARRRGDGEPTGWQPYLSALRHHLLPALGLVVGWGALGGVLVLDLLIAGEMGQPAGDVLRVVLLALLLLYAMGSAALFPVLVSYQVGPARLLRPVVVVGLLFPGRSLLGVAALVAAAAAVWIMPLTIIVAPSLAAAAVWRLYRGAFDRLRARAGDPPSRLVAAPVATGR